MTLVVRGACFSTLGVGEEAVPRDDRSRLLPIPGCDMSENQLKTLKVEGWGTTAALQFSERLPGIGEQGALQCGTLKNASDKGDGQRARYVGSVPQAPRMV